MAELPTPTSADESGNLIDCELEQHMQKLLPLDSSSEKPLELPDAIFNDVSNLLCQAGREEWSLRPRTFVVLWIIHAPELIEQFVQAEAWDIALPYASKSLPSRFSASQRHNFLQNQAAVLTKAAKIEEGSESAHANFGCDASTYLESLEKLGRGGYGSVDRVRSKLSRRVYARKIMKRAALFERDRKALNLFRKEIGHMRKLKHRHLVRYIGSYTDPKYVGILMVPIAECDLHTFLERDTLKPADFECIRQSFGCLCAAIIYLQEQCIRHKDIKPQNILVYGSKVYITDFGLARDWTGKSKSITTGVVDGLTHEYAAPEVLEAEPRGSSSDVWSLGCVFLDMVTVLKGKALIEKKQFLENHGSHSNYISKNQEAYKEWLKELQSDYDNSPLEWVKNMIRMKPKARLTPQSLMAQITDSNDDKRYCGLCCDEQDDDLLLTRSEDEEDLGSTAGSDTQETVGKKTLDPAIIEKRLCNAARTGDIKSITRWLRKASQMLSREGKSPRSFRTKALNEAARTGHEEVAELLIKFGCNLEIKVNGKTPLLTAADNSHEGMVDLLVKHKAKLNAQDSKEGDTALHIVTYKGLNSVTESLLHSRADPNIRNRQNMTPLMIAVNEHSPNITKSLLNFKANALLQSRSGATAMNMAASWGFVEYVEQLLDHGIGIDEQSPPLYHTALHSAARANQPEVAQLLLERGANLNLQQGGAYHANALHFAVSRRHRKVTEVLLKWKPDLEIRSTIDVTALHVAVQEQQHDITEMLLKNGADPNARRRKWFTALSMSLSSGDLDIAQLLIDYGADTELPDQKGATLMHYIAGKNDEKYMQFMLDNNANVNARDLAGMTPLMVAADGQYLVSLGMLLEHGAQTELRGPGRGWTALHMAAYSGLVESVSLLLAFGADPEAKADSGDREIPFTVVRKRRQGEAAKLLSEASAPYRDHHRRRLVGPSTKSPSFHPRHERLENGGGSGLARIESSSSSSSKGKGRALLQDGQQFRSPLAQSISN